MSPKRVQNRGKRSPSQSLAAQSSIKKKRAARANSRHGAKGKKPRGALWRALPKPQEIQTLAKQIAQPAQQLALFAALSAALLWGVYEGYRFLAYGETFYIDSFEIEGNQALEDEEIISLLALAPDANVFRSDMGELQDRLEAHPWIASADVSRQFPGGLEIALVEHRAVAAVELDGIYLINADGELFKRADLAGDELTGLKIVTGISRSEYLNQRESKAAAIRKALAVIEEFEKVSTRPALGEIHLDEQHGITLFTFEDAIAIHLGNPGGDLDERLSAFDKAWQALDAEEHDALRAVRIADRQPSDRVTVAFAGQ